MNKAVKTKFTEPPSLNPELQTLNSQAGCERAVGKPSWVGEQHMELQEVGHPFFGHPCDRFRA